MYKHSEDEGRWAKRVENGGKYLTRDGSWWDGDEDTILLLKAQERPDRTSDEGRFPQKLTTAQVREVLTGNGFSQQG